MPVALWNGLDASTHPPTLTPYDTLACWTGSAVVVDGAGPGGRGRGVVQLYPALCDARHWPGCRPQGTLLAHAVPTDYATDPLLTRWRKPAFNPVMQPRHEAMDAPWADRDPSSPWRCSTGEWRLRTFDGSVYVSDSDEHVVGGVWRAVGKAKDFKEGECPSFYPLPGPARGFEPEYSAVAASGRLPTHVHKLSWHGRDFWQVGTYLEGPRGSAGRFVPTRGWEELAEWREISPGDVFYASKDAEYPSVGGGTRRVNWGWARLRTGMQTLPRQVVFNPVTRGLEQPPIDEMEALRGRPTAVAPPGTQLGGVTLDVPFAQLSQSELLLTVDIPPRPATLTVAYYTDGGPAGQVLACSVAFPGRAPVGAPALQAARVSCSLDCAGAECNPRALDGPVQADLFLAAREGTAELRLFVDHSVAEVFVARGRVALTLGSARLHDVSRLSLSAKNSMSLRSAQVFPLRSIWTDPETVRAAPRVFEPDVAAGAPPPPGVPWGEPRPSPGAPPRECLDAAALASRLAGRTRLDPDQGEWCWMVREDAANPKEACEERYVEPCCATLGEDTGGGGGRCAAGCALCSYERVGRVGDSYHCVAGAEQLLLCAPPPPPPPPPPAMVAPPRGLAGGGRSFPSINDSVAAQAHQGGGDAAAGGAQGAVTVG
eukprot:scaffold29208_cov112-Isochrysis_galbana.AAC.1